MDFPLAVADIAEGSHGNILSLVSVPTVQTDCRFVDSLIPARAGTGKVTQGQMLRIARPKDAMYPGNAGIFGRGQVDGLVAGRQAGEA